MVNPILKSKEGDDASPIKKEDSDLDSSFDDKNIEVYYYYYYVQSNDIKNNSTLLLDSMLRKLNRIKRNNVFIIYI